jgi:SAM-dependent methyltransferase
MLEIRPGSQGLADIIRGYDALYGATPLDQTASFYLEMYGHLEARAGQRLLDVACGSGMLVALAERQGLTAVGLDISKVAVHSGRRQHGLRRMVIGAGENLPFKDGAFDLVAVIGSLEHFFDPAQGAREVRRVLKPGGKAVILVPNTFSLTHVLYVWRMGDVFDDGQPLQRYATRRQWQRLLEQAGLTVLAVRRYERERPRCVADWLQYLRHPGRLLRWLFGRVMPLDAVNCFVFVCARPEA